MRPILRSFLFSTRSPPVTNFHLSSLNAPFGPKNESGWFLSQATLDRFGHHFLKSLCRRTRRRRPATLATCAHRPRCPARRVVMWCKTPEKNRLSHITQDCARYLSQIQILTNCFSLAWIRIKERSRQSDKPSGLQVWPSDRPPH